MNLSVGKKIALGFAVAMSVLLLIGVMIYRDLAQVQEDTGWVTHTLQVQRELSSLMLNLVRIESDSRGYLLSPDGAFKNQEAAARLEAQKQVGDLRQITIDNLHETVRFDRLAPLVNRRFDELEQLTALRDRKVPLTDPRMTSFVDAGRDSMEQIGKIIQDASDEEQHLLAARQARADSTADFTFGVIAYGTVAAFLLIGLAAWAVTRSIIDPLRVLGEGASKIGQGDYAHRVEIAARDEVGELAVHFNRMAAQIEERQRVLAQEDWLKTGLTKMSLVFQGQRDVAVVCAGVLRQLALLLDARHLALYLAGGAAEGRLRFQAGYACDRPASEVRPGQGLVGQAYADKARIVLDEIPGDYLKIRSALGEARPRQIVVQPALYEGEVKAVIELAALRPLTPVQLHFLEQCAESFGIVLNLIEATARTEGLLKQSQDLSTQLQEQQEELKQANEELEQANEEMQQTNEEMEEKVTLLAEQKKEMERINREVERARQAVEEKAAQLAQTSKYKSDFLANMSHELRTPLNSLLILSKMLADNGGGNLTEKQAQWAGTIHSSGNDLLQLINDILDLSKIEAGMIELDPAEMPLAELQRFVERTFRHVAESKGIALRVEFSPELPPSLRTDVRRLEQVVKNLLSNAFKFTPKGSVEFAVAPARSGWRTPNPRLDAAPGGVVAFSVKDTGIGVAPEKQELIFEAFKQADAGTNRTYGGTGLGLSISRELAWQLGGAIELASVPGEGSTFTLYLPVSGPAESRVPFSSSASSSPVLPAEASKSDPAPVPPAETENALALSAPSGVEDDRGNLDPSDRVLLIIEDDRHFARILVDFARERNFKAVVARSVAQGLALARQIIPSAITLDLHLPDNDGWLVLDQLKHDAKTRHIPVHIISVDEGRERSLRLGAVSFSQKPIALETLQEAFSRTVDFVDRRVKNLLIVEDNSTQRESMVDLIGNGDVKTTAVGTAEEAFRALEAVPFDCVVLDLGLPDMQGIDFIRKVREKYGWQAPPVIVYTGKELTRKEETELRMLAESIVVKNVRSPERLLDETALFLHRVQTRLPETQRRMIEQVQKNDSVLAGRKVLVVDDDVRNIFAITSALESARMTVKYAESGQESLDLLEREPDTEIILMDVMMPGMDGFEAIRRIRRIDKFRRTPIISVTAKAMPGDREKCLEAGASDYITKPVDLDRLKSLLRVWLYR